MKDRDPILQRPDADQQVSQNYTFEIEKIPPNALGRRLFPEDLEGRIRNLQLLKTPIGEINTFSVNAYPYHSRRLFDENNCEAMTSIGISTFEDLLNIDIETFDRLPPPVIRSLKTTLSIFMRGPLAVGGEGLLVARAFLKKEKIFLNPISPQAENKRREVLEELLTEENLTRWAKTLDYPQELVPRDLEIIQRTFGLKTDNIELPDNLSKKYSLSTTIIRSIERWYLSWLSSQSDLRQFVPFEKDSFPGEIFAFCQYELGLRFPGSDFDKSTLGGVLKKSYLRSLADRGLGSDTPLLVFFREFKPSDLPPEITLEVRRVLFEVEHVPRIKALLRSQGVLV